MNFKKAEPKYIDQAVELAIREYKNECANNNQLLVADYKNILKDLISNLFNSKYGLVAIEDEQLVGYLIFWGGIEGHFGNVKGAFSPLFGSAFSGKCRKKTATLLFQNLSEIMIKDKIFSFAICKYAHDEEIAESLVLNGFGIRCSDAIRSLANIAELNMDTKCRYEEINYQEATILLDFKNKLLKHMNDNPIYFPYVQFTNEQFLELCKKEKNRFFVAYVMDKPIGYIEISEGAETFISEDSKMLNICGAFVDYDYRNGSIAKELLGYTMKKLANEGVKYLGVDYETLNPTALGFWTKYFKPYTYSFIRRIDERALD